MAISIQTLENLLLNNVLDLRFTRRVLLPNKPGSRRMLCTKSYDLLNSTNGRIVLNYKPPSSGKQFNENKNNACIVWDILMQDYRIVSVDQVSIIRQIPANEEFWTFFNKEIYTLTTEQKILYMES
jgi:hypothetical protein